jgi:ribonucleotide reductase beta subunit family protein with ferritin-like domain
MATILCKLFDSREERLALFPIKYNKIKEFLEHQRSVFWTVPEIQLTHDIKDWETKLNDDTKHFIKYVLAFFAISDGIVNKNIGERITSNICIYEVEMNYNWQKMMEDIHAETYSLMVDTLIKDNDEKEKIYDAINNFPAIKEKAEWALKWIDNDDVTFSDRIFAFACVEGVFFSGSFCAIYWLKKQGLMPGLCFANELISRDEGMHTDFAVLIYHTFLKGTYEEKNDVKLDLTLPQERAYEIIKEAVDIEEKFIIEAIPCRLIGMNEDLMRQYIKYIGDRLLTQFGFKKIWNVQNPFDWMDSISVKGKTNFFEKRVSEYTMAKTVSNEDIEFDY